MEYDKSLTDDFTRLQQSLPSELRDMLPAKTMESFAGDEMKIFQMSAYAMVRFLDVFQPEPKNAFNMAALGFQPVKGREVYFRNAKSVELSSPQEALVLPIRELRPSEKTRLMAMTSYSAVRSAALTGLGTTFAIKGGISLEADRLQDFGKSGAAALAIGGGLAFMYFGGKMLAKDIPQIIAATKASHIGVAIKVPDQPDMTYPQMAESLNNAYAFVY